jgi:NTP pyrophosphatase (non-canonical NTP hydrolase)
MSLVEHATRELELCGQTAEDPAYAAALVAAVAAFASYGHSGGSAMAAIEQLHTLLQFRSLSPLTNDPDEWHDHGEISGTPLWQNRRDPAAMSEDGGQTWYFVDDREPVSPNQIISREYLELIQELLTHYTEHGGLTLERQVIKLQEELGEVAAALIGALGSNPRKGFTHTTTDVAMELADLVITAILGIALCHKDVNETLRLQAEKTQDRLSEFNGRGA